MDRGSSYLLSDKILLAPLTAEAKVIRPVLNFLIFFDDKILQVQKSIEKNTRHQKAQSIY